MSRLIIYPLELSSGGATELKEAFLALGLKALKVKPDGGYSYKTNDIVLGWGNSQRPNWFSSSIPWINHPDRIAVCANKIKTFQCLSTRTSIPVPEWTTDRNVAKGWIDQGTTVVVRQKITGSGGEGIIIAKVKEEVIDAPLYTKYFPRKHEYRVHIMVDKQGNPVIIDFAQKKKRIDFEGKVNNNVRSHANGWIFARQDVVLPAKVKDVACRAIKQLAMDLASVDVGYNESDDLAAVFECNSASGIEASTVDAYVKSLKAYIENKSIPVAPGSIADAPLHLDPSKSAGNKTATQSRPAAAPTPIPEAKQAAVIGGGGNKIQHSETQVIKIPEATDIEIVREGSNIFLYAKTGGSYHPVRLAKIEGSGLVLKQVTY